MEPIDIRFDEHTPREELAEALTHLAAEAHSRIQHLVGSPEHPTRWDLAHQQINHMLVLLEAR